MCKTFCEISGKKFWLESLKATHVNTVKGSEFLDKLNVLLFTSEELSSMELVSL
jgi:hypothetical protein